MGKLDNTKPFYKQFRQNVIVDLNVSNRIENTGLSDILADVAKYCFMGEPCMPPRQVRSLLAKLVQPEHTLVQI